MTGDLFPGVAHVEDPNRRYTTASFMGWIKSRAGVVAWDLDAEGVDLAGPKGAWSGAVKTSGRAARAGGTVTAEDVVVATGGTSLRGSAKVPESGGITAHAEGKVAWGDALPLASSPLAVPDSAQSPSTSAMPPLDRTVPVVLPWDRPCKATPLEAVPLARPVPSSPS